VDKVDYKRSNG